MISVESLTKTFADAEAVRRITFGVEKGEIVGFLGPNGAGKTTTMRMLTCFIAPTAGTAKVAGFDIYEQSVEVRRNVGYLPENVPLYGEMRVDEYLRFRARLKGVARSAVGGRLDYVMGRCGLGDVRMKIIDHLSKGYRQRVGLAEALLHNPPILILDEPTVGLDPNQIRQVREMIRDLGREHTIILSSHILPEVEQVCERVIIINRGEIVAQDRTEVLRQAAGGGDRLEVELKGDRASILEGLGSLAGVLSVSETRGGSADGGRGRGDLSEVASATREEERAAVAGPSAASASAAKPVAEGSGEGVAPATSAGMPTTAPAWSAFDGNLVHATLECAPARDLREDVFRLAVDRGWVLLGLSRRRLSLEDVFIDLTTRDPLTESEARAGERRARGSGQGGDRGPIEGPERGEGDGGDPEGPERGRPESGETEVVR